MVLGSILASIGSYIEIDLININRELADLEWTRSPYGFNRLYFRHIQI